MATDKELKIKITGDATQLGAESKRAIAALNDIKSIAGSLVSGLTGGLIGGGIGGAVQAAVTMIGDKIRDTKALIAEADRLNVDLGTAQAVRNLSVAGQIPVAAAVQSARNARAEAIAGDPEYIRAFEQLGVSVQSIAEVDPATLFYRLVSAMEEFDPAAQNAREKFAALARILGGREVAGELTPYAKGGLFREQKLFGASGDVLASVLAGDPEARFKYKRDFDAPGQFGVGDENKAARLRFENDQRALAVKRSQLSIEEQIAAVAAQRAELEAKINSETDVVKKERLRSDLISLDAEKFRLNQEVLRGVKPSAAFRSFSPQADDFAQRGLFVGGAGMTVVPQILTVHTQKLDQLIHILEAQYRANESNWGQ